MAYSITQKPSLLAASNSPMVFILKETTGSIINAAKFRYIAQVYISTTDNSTWVQKAKIKLYKNANDVGIVDVSKIITTYLKTQEKNVGDQESIDGSIHSIGITDTSNAYSQNTSQFIGVKIVGGYEKAADANSSPEETLNLDNEIIHSIPATTPFTKTGTNEGGLDKDGVNYPLTPNLPDDNNSRFLSNAPFVQFVRGGDASADNVDELTVAFVNRGLVITDACTSIRIRFYTNAGSLINDVDIDSTTSVGGKAVADDMKNSLLYFGCGTRNLENFNDGGTNLQRPSNNTNWAYYTIQGKSAGGAAVKTAIYYFYRYGSGASVDDRHQSCTRYDNVRLAWVNRLGAWDYMNFRGKSVESVDIRKSESAKTPGTWNELTFGYDNWDRGRNTLFSQATRKLKVNSDWLNDDEASWLEELFTSTNVQILGDNNIVYPVILKNKSYIKKSSVNDRVKIQYSLDLEYANTIRTNS